MEVETYPDSQPTSPEEARLLERLQRIEQLLIRLAEALAPAGPEPSAERPDRAT